MTENSAASLSVLKDGTEITFPQGLVGCQSWKRFAFRVLPDEAPIHTLECLDEPDVALYVIDPYLIVSDYTIDMAEPDQQIIGLERASEAVVLAILVIRRDPLFVTANLLGPLVINSRSNLGCQLVLEKAEYSVRHVVFSESPGEGSEEDAA